MAGRPTQKKANVEALKNIRTTVVIEQDNKLLIAYIMHNSGCTFAEIASVFNITRQMAETTVKQSKAEYEA